MHDLEEAKRLLLQGTYTCVICQNDCVFTSVQRGVKPLVLWKEEGRTFQGFSAADKVVGKATAFLYLLLGVRAVYAGVVSRAALETLKNARIYVEYGTLTDYVVNRNKDGVCPFERAVLSIDDKDEAYLAIRRKMDELGISLS